MPIIVHAEREERGDIDRVRTISGGELIRSRHPHFLFDESRLEGDTDLVLLPADEGELIAVVDDLRSIGRGIRLQGRRTGLVGGAVPDGEAVISLERMDAILGVGEDGGRPFVRVQAGVTLDGLDSLLSAGAGKEVTPGAAERVGDRFHYPVDPTERGGSIGGNVAANASGARTFKYGPTRDWVRRVRVLLVDGSVLDLVRGENISADGSFVILSLDGKEVHLATPDYPHFIDRRVKNAAGLYSAPEMDLIDLFIGSEGILGIITEVDLFLVERREQLANVMFLPSNEEAFRFVRLLREHRRLEPEFIEYIDGNGLSLLREMASRGEGHLDMPPIPDAGACVFFDLPLGEGVEDDLRTIGRLAEGCGGSLERSWCAHEPREIARFKRFRHAVPQAVYDLISERRSEHPGLHKHGTDLSVPDEHLEGMMAYYLEELEASGIEYVIFGHIGDNHPHVELLLHDEAELERGKALYERLARRAVSLGGSSSAEHGIGRLKRPLLELMYDPAQIEQMRGVKRALDPLCLLNRGNMFEVGR